MIDQAAPLGLPEPWPAPGKLNLFLHVVGRRPDGYHRLQTAFQFIDLHDEIRFWRRPPGVIERLGEVPSVVPPAGTLPKLIVISPNWNPDGSAVGDEPMIPNCTGTPFGLSTISGCADAMVSPFAAPAPLLDTLTRM